MSSLPSFDVICLSGGGMKGIAQLGALHYMDQISALQQVPIYIGTSIGSAICLLMSVGFTPYEIFSILLVKGDLVNIETTDLLSVVLAFMKDYGITNLDRFIKEIETQLISKLGKVPTFRELYELTGKKLIVTACNICINSMKTEYLSVDTAPEMLVTDAIKASCTIPLLFSRCTIDGKEYVDGAFGDHFPVGQVKHLRVFGVCTNGIYALFSTPFPFLNYLFRFLAFPIISLQNKNHENVDSAYLLYLNIDDQESGSMNFSKDNNSKKKMFRIGYTQCREWVQGLSLEVETPLSLEGWDVEWDLDEEQGS